jgi:hypothetical protein
MPPAVCNSMEANAQGKCPTYIYQMIVLAVAIWEGCNTP